MPRPISASAWVVTPMISSPAAVAARSTAVTSTWAVRSCRPTKRYGSSPTWWRRYARSVPSRRRTGSYSSTGRGAVVDEEEHTLIEGCRRPCDPAVDRERDLRGLTVDEVDVFGGEARGEVVARRRDLGLDERAVPTEVDREFAQLIAASTDAVDGQRVEHLVREHDAGDRLVRGRFERVGESVGGESCAQAIDPPLVDLDRLVAHDRAERRRAERAEQRRREGTITGSVFLEGERRWPSEPLPDLKHGSREHLAEDRMELGGGQEVAAVDPVARPRSGSTRRRGRRARAP